jgi:hypothetical protein
MSILLAAAALFAGTAHAYIDPACQDVADGGPPSDYSEVDQQNFLLNFFSLATTLSPTHGPVPYKPGHGSIGLELSAIPPLSCERRLVLNYTKTEDTNKAPVLPRPRFLVALPGDKLGIFYVGGAYVPPVTVFGTRNVIVSTEVGWGMPTDSGFGYGARFHATMMKTVAEIATPFEEDGEAYDDFYVGSTFGVDALIGYDIVLSGEKTIEPYLAVGLTDVSTFFYIGDDAVVTNNLDPYAGFAGSVGAEFKVVKHLDMAAEFYTAPGVIYTGRTRFAYRW